MDPIVGAIGIVIVAGISGLVTWLIARRAKSGKIDTSEAAVLWEEGSKMRLELRNETISLKEELAATIVAMTNLKKEIQASRDETERAREETRQSRAETRELMHQLAILHGEVKTYNTLTMGALADNAETRRILDVPKEERTDTEFEHLATAGYRQPKADHPPVADHELRGEDIQTKREAPDEQPRR